MSHIITKHVYCPLCEKEMSRRQILFRAKGATVYFCKPCQIGTYDFDPAFNKWRDVEKQIPCTACGHPAIKWFLRYLDGFFKGRCPKCLTEIKKDSNPEITKNGALYIAEDMVDNDVIEEPVEVKIPYAHLVKKFGKDKINALRAKKRNQY